jgi:multicomponent K+:H+ antiporter subunit D
MNHLVVAPVLLPVFVGALIVLLAGRSLQLSRALNLLGCLGVVALGALQVQAAAAGPAQVYALGDWPAPFGIVLVLDRLSALMVLLTGALGLATALYSMNGWDLKGRWFHALFQFQLFGLTGAFLTGDVFNLFVFFEVLLIASYGLMLHGAGAARLKAGLQYVLINLAGSTLFLFAVGMIYAATGTLNMADIAVKAAALPSSDQALFRAGAFLLLAVFALKTALVPLHLWLPRTYAEAPAPVAALFAIMTKVGAYAILRFSTLVFPDAADPVFTGLAIAALLTIALGALGVLAARTMRSLAAFAVVGSVGTLVAALARPTVEGAAAAIWYLPHSTVAGAALFLVADLVRERRGPAGDRLSAAPPFRGEVALGLLFFAAAVAMAGMPPLSGFLGKLLILDATRGSPLQVWVWATILTTTLLVILGFARAGSVLFWKSAAAPAPWPETARPRRWPVAVAALVVLSTAGLSVYAGPLEAYARAAAVQLHDRDAYAEIVLGRGRAAEARGEMR